MRTLYDALDAGYSMAATMHADAPDQVIEMLAASPVSVPRRLLHHTGVIVNIRMDYGDREITRQVNRVTFLQPGEPGELGPVPITLARLGEDGGPERVLESKRAADAVRDRTGFVDLDYELDQRRQTIRGWVNDGALETGDAGAFRERVASYYRRPDARSES